MRLPAFIALAALAGLAACDSAKISELTGAKPPPAQTAAICPPVTAAPACPPAQPAMAPEQPKAAVNAGPTAAHRVSSPARAQRHRVKHVRHATTLRHHAANRAPVRHNAYAGGYTGGEVQHREVYVERHHHGHMGPPIYARPDEAYGRQERRYERRDDGYAQDGYRYERRESGYPPYVDERSDDRSGYQAYRYERRESGSERSGASSSYEHRESGYMSDGARRGDDCDCRPQAAGRDSQGFLTWPGKR